MNAKHRYYNLNYIHIVVHFTDTFHDYLFLHLFWCRIDGEDIRIMLWDTAGQEEFDAITKAYYRGAQACVLAFSTTDRMSFEAIKDWKMKVRIKSVWLSWCIVWLL